MSASNTHSMPPAEVGAGTKALSTWVPARRITLLAARILAPAADGDVRRRRTAARNGPCIQRHHLAAASRRAEGLGPAEQKWKAPPGIQGGFRYLEAGGPATTGLPGRPSGRRGGEPVTSSDLRRRLRRVFSCPHPSSRRGCPEVRGTSA